MTRWKLLLLVLGLAGCRAVFAAVDVVVMYQGGAATPAGVQLGAWGGTQANGETSPVRPVHIRTGAYGIPISTLGRYQGTRIDFMPPLDTQLIFGATHTYLELYLRAGAPDEKGGVMPALENLCFTFFTATGSGSYTLPSSAFFPADLVDQTWVRIAFPLNRVLPADRLRGTLNRLVLTSDTPANFQLGRLAVVHDMSTLQANITTAPAVLETGKAVYFNANANGGIAPCEATWDFDTAAGVSIDATGNQVTHVFVNPGTYLITCTIRDMYGMRDPVTVTREIRVIRSRT